MNSKMLKYMALMFPCALVGDMSLQDADDYKELTPEEKSELIKRLEEKRKYGERLRKLERGAKIFMYGDVEIISLNKKNADKKAKRLGIKP